MYVKFQGTPSGLQSGDAITKIELVWIAGTITDLQAQATAETTNKITLNAGTDDAKIAAFQSGGVVLDCGSLVSGTVYTPASRITESRGGSGSFVGNWVSGGTFNGPTPLAAPSTSLAANATTDTLSFGAVTNAVGYKAYYTTDTTTPTTSSTAIQLGNVTSFVHSGMTTSYRYKLVTINTYGQESSTLSSTITPV